MSEKAPESGKTPIQVFALGDSIVLGTGDSAARGWVGRFVEQIHGDGRNIRLYNLGVGSETVTGLSQRWRSEVERRMVPELPAVFLVSFGLNDASRDDEALRVPLDACLEVARSLVGEVARLGQLFQIGPIPVDESRNPRILHNGQKRWRHNAEISAYDRALAAMAAELKYPYLSLTTALAALPDWSKRLTDGVHPDAEGYELLARLISTWPPLRTAFRNIS